MSWKAGSNLKMMLGFETFQFKVPNLEIIGFSTSGHGDVAIHFLPEISAVNATIDIFRTFIGSPGYDLVELQLREVQPSIRKCYSQQVVSVPREVWQIGTCN